MLNPLTDAQKILAKSIVKEWKDKFGNIRINKEEVTEGLEYVYSTINKPLPKIVWVCSPLAMQETYQSISPFVGDSVQAIIRDYGLGVGTSVVESMLKSSFNSGVSFVGDVVWLSVTNYRTRQSIRYIVKEYLRDFVGREKYQLMGSLWSTDDWDYLAKLDYSQRIGIKHGREIDVEKILKLQSLYDYLPYENAVIVCEHPKYPPKTNAEGRMHSDGSPVIEWEDGFKDWSLNGVRVPQYLAETPAGKLDLDWYLYEKNADVKAQFILKYGIDRMSDLGDIVDSYKNYKELNEYWKKSEYELIDMAPIQVHEGMDKALYLKMKNLTVDGVYHLEGVSNECKTIYDAIKCRWNGIDPNNFVTINIK